MLCSRFVKIDTFRNIKILTLRCQIEFLIFLALRGLWMFGNAVFILRLVGRCGVWAFFFCVICCMNILLVRAYYGLCVGMQTLKAKHRDKFTELKAGTALVLSHSQKDRDRPFSYLCMWMMSTDWTWRVSATDQWKKTYQIWQPPDPTP
jgi:hypothetical protein